MANTKELTREERKTNKRSARKVLKKAYSGFNATQMDDYRKKLRGGVKGYLLGTNEEND